MSDRALDPHDIRHLLRRLSFAATREQVLDLEGLDRREAFERIWSDSRDAPLADGPEFLAEPWVNGALRRAGMPLAEHEVQRAAQKQAHERQVQALREAWLERMIASRAGLRENLLLLMHDLFGSSSATVEIPHALAARNRLLAQACMTSFPDLIEALVLDPAMMIQIGLDGHGPFRVSDRPAVLILEHWTVGAGAYTAQDVGELSRALTGWTLRAAAGDRDEPALDPAASLAERRTGLVPTFDDAQFEAGPKTILGMTADFDARAAVRHLALQPATARRVAGRLLRFFGVSDADGELPALLERTYLDSGGSMHALLAALVDADGFWSEASRWSLIKSPVHLAVGACRQLALEPPLAALDQWLHACGQTLLETPNNGEGGWPDQEAWISPPDRLAIRYRLPTVLAGEAPDLGLRPPPASAQTKPSGVLRLPASIGDIFELLDPAPGLDAEALRAEADDGEAAALVRLVMATPHYQLA